MTRAIPWSSTPSCHTPRSRAAPEMKSPGALPWTRPAAHTSPAIPTLLTFPPSSHLGGPYQTGLAGKYDVFVAKLNPQGNLHYMTYLGGELNDFAYSIAVDEEGAFTGVAWSPDFPLQNPFQTFEIVDCPKAFVTKLSYWGQQLVFSTYLGGNGFDAAGAIPDGVTRTVPG